MTARHIAIGLSKDSNPHWVLRTGIDGWDAMHSTLGTERTVITSTVKQYADPVRHGNWRGMKPTTAKDRWRMLRLTRDILVKYMDYAAPAN